VAAPVIDHPIVINIPLIRPIRTFHEEGKWIGVTAIVSRATWETLIRTLGQHRRTGKALTVLLFE
jgi:hypothetical protein